MGVIRLVDKANGYVSGSSEQATIPVLSSVTAADFQYCKYPSSPMKEIRELLVV